jgi:integrase
VGRRTGLQSTGKEIRLVTVEEAAAIEAAIDPWWKLAIPFLLDTGPFLLDTGLLVSELAGLRVCDFDLGPGGSTVSVRQVVTEAAGLTVGPPKKRAAVREVPVGNETMAARLTKQISDRRLSSHDHVFRGERGGVMSPNTGGPANSRKHATAPGFPVAS